MSATSSCVTSPGLLEERDRGLRLVGVDVDLEGRLVADDEHRVAELLQHRHEGAALEARAGDDEVGAVAVAAVLVVRARVRRRRVVRHRRGGLDVAAQARDDPGEDHDEAVRAGVDDSGLPQHLELLRSPGDGLPRRRARRPRAARRAARPARRAWRRARGGSPPCGRGAGRSSGPSRGRRSASCPRPARGPTRRRRRRPGRRPPRPASGRPAPPAGWRAPRRRRGRSG